jgi:hypothetical protein
MICSPPSPAPHLSARLRAGLQGANGGVPRSSASPHLMVLRSIPVIRDTVAIPARFAANASVTANRHRPRSSSTGLTASYRILIAVSSTIPEI